MLKLLTSKWVCEIHVKFLAHLHSGSSSLGVQVNLITKLINFTLYFLVYTNDYLDFILSLNSENLNLFISILYHRKVLSKDSFSTSWILLFNNVISLYVTIKLLELYKIYKWKRMNIVVIGFHCQIIITLWLSDIALPMQPNFFLCYQCFILYLVIN